MIGTILLFLVVLSVLVLVHELGHFLAAKKMGMQVDEFGIGFPPRLFGVKRGEVLYSVNLIPLGGFVKVHGETGDHANDPRSFASKSLWQRFVVLIAGVVMNLVLAAVLFAIGFFVGLPSVIDGNVPASAQVSNSALSVVRVVGDSVAEQAGLRVGDSIVSVDDRFFETEEELITYLGQDDATATLMVRRGVDVRAVETERVLDELGTPEPLGVAIARTGNVRYPPVEAVWRGVFTAGEMTVVIVVAFVDLIGGLVSGGAADGGLEVSGPVGIAVMTGQVAELGFGNLIQFMAILSINLAILNVLPFPALDGGRILFLAVEVVRRKRPSATVEAITHNIGFLLLIGLVLVVTYQDIVRFGGKLLGGE